ncbi:MAG: hypothetical protein AVDCRST_MAG15-498 [uncultured Rubellimicrobium sp.]|uniref:Uncharacterized protein n=1 Tax=uncultured Rubellimicrobium sp. TaxID=543078 RepID=A0A6J4NM97_9RHOB|nr:MAG: hypothetical protein AVDCRST_MAG15-498 [uncultured Rubellimicrobium sp.]
MRMTSRAVWAGLSLITVATPLLAADPSDPDWPCIQRRVEHLSIGVMWPHPIPEEAGSLPDDLRNVAAQLALRRVSEEQARDLVAEVAADRPDFTLDDYARLYQVTFDQIDRQRAEIVTGIVGYAQNQSRLAAEIDELQAQMAQMEAAEEPDFDRIDEIEAELDGRLRVFNDRASSLTYVCESPVLLEQRAYSIAQIMLAAAG